MTNDEKIRVIHTWSHSFEIVRGDNRWYAKIKYACQSQISPGLTHSTMYFNYDDMVEATYLFVSMRIHGFIKNTLGNLYDR